MLDIPRRVRAPLPAPRAVHPPGTRGPAKARKIRFELTGWCADGGGGAPRGIIRTRRLPGRCPCFAERAGW